MTIEEAIRSGKRFKRKASNEWLTQGMTAYTTMLYVDYNDILARDWEVEVVKKELSAEDIRLAIRDSLLKADMWQYEGLINCVVKNLGLE